MHSCSELLRLAAVSRERNIDPSSVSRAIAGLEEELGIRLLQRTTRQLSPTEAGTTYFERIEPLVEEMQQAIIAAADISGQPKGTLRVRLIHLSKLHGFAHYVSWWFDRKCSFANHNRIYYIRGKLR